MRPAMILLESMVDKRSSLIHREWNVHDLEPVLLYKDEACKIHPFFSELIFAPMRTSSGRFLCDLCAGYDPAVRKDWLEWADKLYHPKRMLHAVSSLADQYQLPKIGIWIRLPYPVISDRCFDNEQHTFQSEADRLWALTEWVRGAVSRWKQRFYASRLELKGFVWGREGIPPHDRKLAAACNHMIHSLGYETIWLANYLSMHVGEWQALGYDHIALYPNYTGNTEQDTKWLTNTVIYTTAHKMGLQMIAGRGRLYSPDHYDEYREHLKIYLTNGGAGPVIYRFPNWSLIEIYEENRGLYDQIYQSLPQADGGKVR